MFRFSLAALPAAILVLASAAAAQRADSTGGAASAPRPVLPGASLGTDSLAGAQRAARQAQAVFERARVAALPFYSGGGAQTPDVRFGGIYYSNNNNDVPPKPEGPEITQGRLRLLQALGEQALRAPTDDWIAGQRVKYTVEAKDLPGALAIATTGCRGTRWWCKALEGYVHHARVDAEAAGAAFAEAVRLMPAQQACDWKDMSPWLEGADQVQYRAASCAARDSINRYVLWLGKPFWHRPGNDLANELLARRTINAIEQDAVLAQSGVPFADIAASQIRYGWPVSWSTQNTIVDQRGSMVSSIIGHEPVPSHNFMPSLSARRAPFTATAADFPFNARLAPMRYAPRYVSPGGFTEMGYQFARFRRADSTLLVGAWQLDGKGRWERGTGTAALVLQRSPDSEQGRLRRERVPLRGALTVPLQDSTLASLEVLSDARKFAGRARTGVKPLERGTQLSDLLLLAARSVDGDAPGSIGLATLDAALPRALGTTILSEGQTFGVYWEYYGAPGATMTLSIVPADSVSGIRRVASMFRLAEGRQGAASLRFPDPAQPGGGPGRRLVLVMPEVRPGRYQLSLQAAAPGQEPVRREVLLTVPEP